MIYGKTNVQSIAMKADQSSAMVSLNTLQTTGSLNIYKNSANKFGRKTGFKIENEFEDHDQSFPKFTGILTELRCIFGQNLEILTSTGGEWSCGQAQTIYVYFSCWFFMLNNRLILYNMIDFCWYDEITNTLRDLHSETYFRVKCNGKISSRIVDTLDLDESGKASFVLFRKYMAGLSHHLHQEFSFVVKNKPITCVLEAYDLVLYVYSDIPWNVQRQLDCLKEFYANSLSYIVLYNDDLTLYMVLILHQKWHVCYHMLG